MNEIEMSYEDAHKELADKEPEVKQADAPEIEAAEPAQNAVKAAAQQARDEDAKAFSDAFNSDSQVESPKPEKDQLKVEPISEKPKTFKEAFASARKDGLKVFDFNGKKFTTEMKAKAKPAEPVVKAPEAVAPEVKAEAPAAKADKSIYDDNTFPKNIINAVKSKMGDKANVSKTLPNGKPNLTAA